MLVGFFCMMFCLESLVAYSSLLVLEESTARAFNASQDADPGLGDEPVEVEIVLPPGVQLLQALIWLLYALMMSAAIYIRTLVVRKYNVAETLGVSAAVSICCTPCSLGQQMMHIDLEEHGSVDTECTLRADHPNAQPQGELL
jgi:hypothetical protein